MRASYLATPSHTDEPLNVIWRCPATLALNSANGICSCNTSGALIIVVVVGPAVAMCDGAHLLRASKFNVISKCVSFSS